MKSRRDQKVEVEHSAPIPIPNTEQSPRPRHNFSFYVGSPRSEHMSSLSNGLPPLKSKPFAQAGEVVSGDADHMTPELSGCFLKR